MYESQLVSIAMDFQERYKKQIAWLLDGDPSIRYQALRDLVNAPDSAIHKARQQILKEGWGRRVMELQEDNGTWSHALYSPMGKLIMHN